MAAENNIRLINATVAWTRVRVDPRVKKAGNHPKLAELIIGL